MAKTYDRERRDMPMDVCCRCRLWEMAMTRRRGGQPVRCWQCGTGMKRIAWDRWAELVKAAAEGSRVR